MTMQDPSRADLRSPDAGVADLRALVDEAAKDPSVLKTSDPHARAVREVIYRLDQGELRVAERSEGPERWRING